MLYINNVFFLRLIAKIATLFKTDIFYKNKYGIKCIRRISINQSHPALSYKAEKIVFVNPLSLKYGFDYLKDNFSNTEKNICDTPHYNLIDCCARGKPEESIYLQLEKKGCLDSRDGFSIKNPSQYHMSHFNEAKDNMESNKTKPIRIFIVNGNYYIFDGKHRAALYAYYKRPSIAAIVVPTNLIVPSKPKFLKAGKAYSKQRCLYNKLISCDEVKK